MTKTTEAAVEWLIETVKEALEEGRATETELEEWLLAAILLEEIAIEEEGDDPRARPLDAWFAQANGTLH